MEKVSRLFRIPTNTSGDTVELLESGGLEAIEEGREIGGEDWDDEVLHEWSVWRWRSGDLSENGDHENGI